MSHEVESMCFVGETPWHGLGVKVDGAQTAETMARAAGLDWGVSLIPLVLATTHTPAAPVVLDGDGVPRDDVKPHRAVVRDSDARVLGVVGPEYTPLQNREAFAWFDPWIASGIASYHTAGSLRGGRRIWVLAQVQADPLEIVRGDTIAPFVLLSSSHDGSLKVNAGFTPIRVVCANTLHAAQTDGRSKLISLRHTSGLAAGLDAVRETMDVLRGEFQATAEQYRALATNKAIDRRTVEAYVKSVFRRSDAPAGIVKASDAGANGDDAADGSRVVPRVLALLDGGLRGDRLLPAASTQMSWWRAFNAVTEYLDHERGTDRDSRLVSAWWGDGATLRRRAFDLAQRFAA